MNLLTAALALAGFYFYVFIYTRWLKRRTAAEHRDRRRGGGLPPAGGLGGGDGVASISRRVYLFLIVFYWTPPHFWALALNKQVDYRRAGVPMAPLVWGERETMRNMLWYTFILIALTLLPALFGAFGLFYVLSAVALNAILLGGVIQVLRKKVWSAPAWWLYKYSLLYLALLFAAMVIDRVIAR